MILRGDATAHSLDRMEEKDAPVKLISEDRAGELGDPQSFPGCGDESGLQMVQLTDLSSTDLAE